MQGTSSIQLDLTTNASGIASQIAQLQGRIADLGRTAADVYAMRGDAGMIGLKRQIDAAKEGIVQLSAQLAQLGQSNITAGLINQIQGLDRAVSSARAAAATFRNAPIGQQAFVDDSGRQLAALRSVNEEKRRQEEQDIARLQRIGAMQRLQAAQQLRDLKTFYREQESAQLAAQKFSEKLAPSSSVNQQREELKHQYDAEIAANEKLAQVNRTRYQEQITKLKEYGAEQEKAQRQAFRFQEQLAPRTDIRYDSSLKKFVEDSGKASQTLSELEFKFGSLRHVIAIFDESMRGQRGAMIASVSALIRDSGALEIATKSLAGPWGLVAAAGVGALVGIIIEAERAHARLVSIRDIAGSMARSGEGQVGVPLETTASIRLESQRASTSEYLSNEIKIQEALQKTTGVSRQYQGQIENLAKSLKGLTWGNSAKEAEELTKEINKGPEAFGKAIEATLNLQGAQNKLGKSLQDVIAEAQTMGGKIQAVIDFANELRESQLKAGAAANVAQNNVYAEALSLGTLQEGLTAMNPELGKLVEDTEAAVHPTKDLTGALNQLTDAELTQNVTLGRLNEGLERYKNLANDIKNIGDLVTRTGLNSRADDPDPNRGKALIAQQNAIANANKMPLMPGQEAEHERIIANINAEAQARHADLTSQAQAATQRREEAERVARLRPGADTNTSEVIDAKNAEAEAWRKVEDEKRQIAIDSIRTQIAEEHRGAQERIALAEKVLAMDKAASDSGRESKLKVAQDEIALSSLRRQVANQTFQEERDATREAVELAHTHANAVEEIVAAYNKLRAAAQATGQTPAVQQQIEREQTRDLIRAQTDAFQKYSQSLRAQDQVDQTRIKSFSAGLQTMVAQNQISKSQMAGFEAQYTAQVYEQEEKRYEAALNTAGLTEGQAQELSSRLAEIYEKDAETYMQLQAKMTEATKKENEERAKVFISAFDKIGSGIKSALEGALEGDKISNIYKNLRKSLISGVVDTLGGVLDEVAGKKLADVLGVKVEEGKSGIGDVLGTKLAQMFGLQKSTDTKPGERAQEKLSRAAELQQKVAEQGLKAAEELQKAAQMLQGRQGAQDSTTLGGAGKTGTSTNLTEGLSGGGKFTVAGGADITKGNEPIIADIYAHAAARLGEGYRVNLTEGFATSGHAKDSAHYEGNAADVHIYGPQGEIPNKGPDTTGMYGLLNKYFTEYQEANYPELSKYHRYGAAFETKKGSGQADLMHQDFKGAPLDTAGLQRLAAGNDKVVQSNDKLIQATAMQAKEIQASASNDNKLNSSVTTNDQKTDENTKAVDRLTDKIGSVGTSGTQIASAKQGDTSAATDPNANSGAGSSLKSATNNLSTSIADITGVLGSIGALAGLLGGKNSPIARDIGIAGSVISVFSGLFKLGGFFGLFEQGGIVPSAAGGMIVGGASGGTLSLLHPREMVLPAGISQGLQGMIGQNRPANDNSLSNNSASSSDVYHIHVHAPDGPAAHRFLMNNSDSIVAAMQKSRRNFR